MLFGSIGTIDVGPVCGTLVSSRSADDGLIVVTPNSNVVEQFAFSATLVNDLGFLKERELQLGPSHLSRVTLDPRLVPGP